MYRVLVLPMYLRWVLPRDVWASVISLGGRGSQTRSSGEILDGGLHSPSDVLGTVSSLPSAPWSDELEKWWMTSAAWCIVPVCLVGAWVDRRGSWIWMTSATLLNISSYFSVGSEGSMQAGMNVPGLAETGSDMSFGLS